MEYVGIYQICGAFIQLVQPVIDIFVVALAHEKAYP